MARPSKDPQKKPSGPSETPLMKQYFAIKAKYPGALLLFRVGDFYETFGEDAVEVSRIVGIVLTSRNNGGSDVELAGFPHHSLDTYLPRLVRAGKRVAVCDQLEDPAQAKGIVKRGVTELVTPGVTFNDKVLELNKANYLAAVHAAEPGRWGVAFIEVSTGDFFCFSGESAQVEKTLNTLQPAEVLLSKQAMRAFKAEFGEKFFLTRQEDWVFQPDYARERLLGHFGAASLKGLGIEEEKMGTIAAGAILHYLNDSQQLNLGHVNRIYRFDDSGFVWLDPFTVRNLELLQPMHPGGKALVDVIDESLTPMGARQLRRALLFPLKSPAQIRERLDVVEALLRVRQDAEAIAALLRRFGDLERLAAKVATLRLSPREAALLRSSLGLIEPLRQSLLGSGEAALMQHAGALQEAAPALQALHHYLHEEPAGSINEGGVIRQGVSEELDELRRLQQDGKSYLLQLQQREIERTGISSLKVAYNKVFGYYLEVSNTHQHKAPAEWIRKQTLSNAERYITPELKTYEDKILNAQERILSLESALYQAFLQQMQQHVGLIQQNARAIAALDMLLSFSRTALRRGYARPDVNEGSAIRIEAGRHPVIETTLPADSPYVPNDLLLDGETQQIIIITGPNMAGKSALLRQTALIVLLAQVGSFVPASAAQIGVVDKIYTRVGASDNISSGESTFMVEMNETAQIVNGVSSQSLVLLDEIGRGTSTYDGVSIAWALVEYLHETPGQQPRTLFATHYHELNELEERLPRVRNYNVSVRELEGKVLFLRSLKPGGSAHSFGINVAAMAGMPGPLVKRAQQLLKHFEANRVNDQAAAKRLKFADQRNIQLNMFELKDADTVKIRQILSGVDVDRMTPVEALLKLQEIKLAIVEAGD